jgi:hypothetical protein
MPSSFDEPSRLAAAPAPSALPTGTPGKRTLTSSIATRPRADLNVIELARDELIKLKQRAHASPAAADDAGRAAAGTLHDVSEALARVAASERASDGHGAAMVLHRTLRDATGDGDAARGATTYLDSIIADALEIDTAAHSDDVHVGVKREIAGVKTQGAALGWDPPETLDAARARKYEQEPCPFGDDSPRACTLTDGKRATTIDDIRDRLNTVAANFFDACKAREQALQAAMDREQKLAEALVGIVVDVMLTAVTGPVAAGLTKGLRPAAGAASDLGKFASDVRKTLLRSAVKLPPVVVGGGQHGDTRARTIDALLALEQQFRQHIDETKASMRTLDDDQLLTLRARAEGLSDHKFGPDVDAYAKAYQQQVAPIGLENDSSANLIDDDGWFRGDKQAIGRAVRVVLPGGGEGLAVGVVVSDRVPALRMGARRAAVAADRLLGTADDDLFTGRMVRDRQDAWVDTPDLALHFVRWIDDPRMQAMAAGDARPVPAARVLDLPLAGLVAPAASDDGR